MKKKSSEKKEKILDDDVLIEEYDEEIPDEKEICKYYDFAFLGKIKRKSGEYEKVVLVNRWAWMTDQKYRKVYPPVMEIIQVKGFIEKDLALVEVKMEKEDIINYLTSLNMRYNSLLENHALPYFKNSKI